MNAATVNNNDNNDKKFTIDIRVFLAVIVTSMTISFGLGVGIIGGGGVQTPIELPKVTSVMVQDAATAAAGAAGDELHEPAGQVRKNNGKEVG
jgi:hypothetical protein